MGGYCACGLFLVLMLVLKCYKITQDFRGVSRAISSGHQWVKSDVIISMVIMIQCTVNAAII